MEQSPIAKLKTFLFEDETGAITVDWVVLTAGIVGLALATIGLIADGSENLSGDIATTLSARGTDPAF